jgi:hypothetical protein
MTPSKTAIPVLNDLISASPLEAAGASGANILRVVRLIALFCAKRFINLVKWKVFYTVQVFVWV